MVRVIMRANYRVDILSAGVRLEETRKSPCRPAAVYKTTERWSFVEKRITSTHGNRYESHVGTSVLQIRLILT